MRIALFAGVLAACTITQDLRAQQPSTPFGRLGLSAGMMYTHQGYGAQIGGSYHLTPENRPVSFRVEGYAAWPKLRSTEPSFQVGAVAAAIVHAKPRSRVSPYLILGYGINQRWREGVGPSRRGHLQGEFVAGVGLRVRVGGQTLRLEAVSSEHRIGITLGMSIPF